MPPGFRTYVNKSKYMNQSMMNAIEFSRSQPKPHVLPSAFSFRGRSTMSSKLLNQRASEDEASRGASPATASSEDSRAMIGLIAAAAASVPPAAVAAAASADSTSTSPTKATKAGKKKKAKATPVKEAAALADLASSDSGKSPAARQQHQLPMFLSSKSILVNTCCVLAWHIFIFRPHLKPCT